MKNKKSVDNLKIVQTVSSVFLPYSPYLLTFLFHLLFAFVPSRLFPTPIYLSSACGVFSSYKLLLHSTYKASKAARFYNSDPVTGILRPD